MKKKYGMLFAVCVVVLAGCKAVEPQDLIDEGFTAEGGQSETVYKYNESNNGSTVSISYKDAEEAEDSSLIIDYSNVEVVEKFKVSGTGSAYCDVDDTSSLHLNECLGAYQSLSQKANEIGAEKELVAATNVFENETGITIS